VLDLPGHGRSTLANAPTTLGQFSEVLLAMVNQLGIARPFLLGAGCGASVAIHFAAEHPRRVRGLVLVSPEGLLAGPRKTGVGLASMKLRGRWIRTWLWPRSFVPAERQRLRELVFARSQPGIYQELLNSLVGKEEWLRASLGSAPCPALFAFSRDAKADPLNGYLAVLDPLLKTSGQHRFTVFAGSFSPVWDETGRFLQALMAFVQAQLPLHEHRHAWVLTAVDWPATGTNLWKCVHPDCKAERVLPVGDDANTAG
jgi:pimeloyl-ACP methyl ester carboxylesterase